MSGAWAFLLTLALAIGLGGCGGGGGTPKPPPPPPPPIILTAILPDGLVGTAYGATLHGTSGRQPYTWSISAGALPAGLSLTASTGVISGTPTTAGTLTFTVHLVDDSNQSATHDYTIAIGNLVPLVERVSLASDGSSANGDSGTPALSSDGRFVAFTSFATNLVAADTNNFADVFLLDRTCSTTVLVSLASDGTQANSQSFSPALSVVNSGRLLVAYVSDATNLVPNDTNQGTDVFVTTVDVSSCPPAIVHTVRVSVASDGTESSQNSRSLLPSISANGLVVAYHSNASNLAPADNNVKTDTFVTELDLSSGTPTVVRTRRASLMQGRLAIGVGRTTADIFSETTIGSSNLTMTDHEHIGRKVEILQGAGAGQLRTVTDNDATTLTISPPFGILPAAASVFRVIGREDIAADIFSDTTLGSGVLAMDNDEQIGRVLQIVSGTGEGQLRQITGNTATTFTVTPAWDPVPDATSVFRLLRQGSFDSLRPKVSANGAFVIFDTVSSFEEEDTNSAADVFLFDIASGATSRVSLDSFGGLALGNSAVGGLSANGSQVLFLSTAANLSIVVPPTFADIFSSTTIGSSTLALTPDAHKDQFVVIVSGLGVGQSRKIASNTETTLTVSDSWSPAPNASSIFDVTDDLNNQPDLFIHDRNTGETTRVSLASDGAETNGATDFNAALSANGVAVAFASLSSNLAEGDRNGVRDIFLRNRTAGTTTRISRAVDDTNPNAECVDPAVSLDGSTVAFSSTATNLVPGDTNNARDVFLFSTGIVDPPVFITSQLPRARQGVAYSAQLPVAGGTQPLFWTFEEGSRPPGLFLDARDGTLAGIPLKPGQYQFSVLVIDAGRPPRQSHKTFTLVVDP